jgi:hypothetical protein
MTDTADVGRACIEVAAVSLGRRPNASVAGSPRGEAGRLADTQASAWLGPAPADTLAQGRALVSFGWAQPGPLAMASQEAEGQHLPPWCCHLGCPRSDGWLDASATVDAGVPGVVTAEGALAGEEAVGAEMELARGEAIPVRRQFPL